MDRLVLATDQLLALAYILNAKYLDFYYISAVNKTEDSELWLSENKKQLVALGILVEDFSGNMSIHPEAELLLKPLFFSTKESSLDINIFGDSEENIGYRFHFLDGKITMTKAIEEGLEVSEVSRKDIQIIVSDILPTTYSVSSTEVDVTLDVSEVSRVFIVKNTEMKVKSLVKTMVETNGIVYEEDPENNIYSLSKADFEDKVYKILTEV